MLVNCTDLTQFVSMLGDLPARVTAELTEMLYKTNDDSIRLPIGAKIYFSPIKIFPVKV
jgi:hypothetical protein